MAAFVGVGVACVAISVVGAGFDSHVRYLDVIGDTQTTGIGQLSAARVAVVLRVPSALAPLVTNGLLAFGVIEVLALAGRRPGLAYAVAVVTLVLGSPVVNPNTLAILLAAFAPAAWPLVSKPLPARAGGDDDRRSLPSGLC